MAALHLIGFPHTRLDESSLSCAYTQKVQKMRRMDLGRDLIVYGCEGADVRLLAERERIGLFGHDDPGRLPAWPTDAQWELFNKRAIRAVWERYEDGDLLLLAGGWSQKPVADALPLTACEPGVGYPGIATDFCAFESHAWRHHVYGLKGIEDGRWFDTVIPNYFDVDDFPAGDDDGGYLLYVGRLIERKGVRAACDIAHAAGLPLKIAGPGDERFGDADYLGPVNARERAELMGGAVAVLAPTLYIEPFGGVAVEAQLCGTPAITSDWGAFTETVEPEWRFATLADAVEAVDCAANADRAAIRDRARSLYSLEAVGPQFAAWFDRLDTLRGAGWYMLPTEAVA